MIRYLLCILLLITPLAQAEENPFIEQPAVKQFIAEMVKKHHFDAKELNTLFNKVSVRPAVIQSIKAPLEQKPWHLYKLLFVTPQRISQGVIFWNKHQAILEKAEKIYGVPASIIVATIGIETRYGQNTGNFKVIDALVNLAFGNSSRNAYFKSELEQFLLLTREQHLDPFNVMGSYAGAIGQPQFMPSSYRAYAVNFSNHGSIDLSHDEADVIGSIANYYKKHGWKTNEAVAAPISMGGGEFAFTLSKVKPISLSEIMKSHELNQQPSKIVKLQGQYGAEYWQAFPNFGVIKRYNNNDLYAMAVYQLSYYINAMREKQKHD